MIPTIRTTVLAGAAVLIAATPTLADNAALTPEQTKVRYELQERCGKDAAAFFDRIKTTRLIQPIIPTQTTSSNFQNHYSTEFNKCFMTTYVMIGDLGEAGTRESQSLWDVNDNRMIGDFLTVAAENRKVNTVMPRVARCWVWKPEKLNTLAPTGPSFALGDVNYCVPDQSNPGQFIVSPPDYGKWHALIKPYMQDSE